jgi:hypothetical protein
MAIPKNVKEALDPYFRIDECADIKELQAWMTWTTPAMNDACEKFAIAQNEYDLAEFEYNKEYGKQYKLSEATDVTTKKEDSKVCESVLEKEKARIEAKHKMRMAEVLVTSMKEKAGCIRKIATLRSNTVQFDEDDDKNSKRKNYKNTPSAIEQPYPSNTGIGNFLNFMQ